LVALCKKNFWESFCVCFFFSRRSLEKKQAAINEFLNRYSLTPEEELALKDGTIDSKFFSALQRVKQIHSDSKQLIRSSGEHLAAMEIIEEMAGRLEQAYEVLYRSIQSMFLYFSE
uniref:Conserved oligomeric Golgi complex subunit 6 n=1 Tax=Gongylonema pulchrum TaxID=637853 RepID=A0A183D8L6_9BILA